MWCFLHGSTKGSDWHSVHSESIFAHQSIQWHNVIVVFCNSASTETNIIHLECMYMRLWADRNDPGRIHKFLGAIIGSFDVIKIRRVMKARIIPVQLAKP